MAGFWDKIRACVSGISKSEKKLPFQKGKPFREPRVKVVPLAEMVADLKQPALGEVKIGNLSASGIGFLILPGVNWPETPFRVEGVLRTPQEVVSFVGEAVHRTGEIMGVRFLGELSALKRLAFEYFSLEIKARAMSEVRQDLLKLEKDGKPRWFRSSNGFELFYVKNDSGEIPHFYLTFLGNYFDFGRGHNLRYGFLYETGKDDGVQYRGVESVKYVSEISEENRLSAIRMVENVAGFEGPDRDFLIKKISGK